MESTGPKNVQCILTIHGFQICEFSYSLKCICNPKITIHNILAITCIHMQSSEQSESPTCMFSGEEPGNIISSCFSSHAVNRYTFYGLFSMIFFYFLVLFCWQFCCFKWFVSVVLKCSLVFLSTQEGYNVTYA